MQNNLQIIQFKCNCSHLFSKQDEVRVDRKGRVDCFPDAHSAAVTLTREACEARSCQFDAKAAKDNSLGMTFM